MKQSLTLPEVVKEALKGENIALPDRVLMAIARQENSSEVLVKLIQLTVVAVWGVLYLVSPKTHVGTPFAPVPFALAGYMLLNMVGLFWALRRGLPNWAVYFSIFIDIAMLMVLIWSFHIQYDQPPSFYLKAPTLLYIFIFIALRALRFQARFVIASGVAAALGWITLTLYVVMSNPKDTMITRNYVDYMTSNSVLVGAEVDKVISILLVTAIIALALRRANNLLVQSVAEHTAARDLSRFFDESVAAQIRSADHIVMSGEGVRRDAAILFVDIRGFTPMAAKMDASQVLAILSAYEKRIVPLIQRNGGTIDKFLGDGIMATFGAVTESETFAADALRAIDDIMTEVEDWPNQQELSCIEPCNVNASVAAGPVVFGALGGENRLEYTTIGAAVNLAAKLEKHNKAANSRALTDSQTWMQAVRQGYEAKGQPQTVNMSVNTVGEQLELTVLYPA